MHVAFSLRFHSVIIVEDVRLSVDSTTATSISLAWTSAGSVVASYKVVWQRDTSGTCPDVDSNSAILTDGSITYVIMDVEEISSYSVQVTATNAAGSSSESNEVIAETQEAGRKCIFHSL